MGLSDKQSAFVNEYLVCWNATEAARRAGYSEKYLHTNASKILQNTTVQDEIKSRMSDLAMTADEVLLRLGKMARSSVDDIITIDKDGYIKLDFAKAKENGAIHLIKSIIPTAHGTKVEMHDQRGALNDIGKYLGMEYKAPEQEKLNSNNPLPSIPAEMIAPDFLNVYRDILAHNNTEYLIRGGRGSTKSSFVSLVIPFLIIDNPEFNALCLRNHANTLRGSVFSQINWAISILGLDDLFKSTISPMEIEYLPTGQKIYFRGADKPKKLKSTVPEKGYIAILWLEELDQFGGATALRSIKQTAIRGGDEAYQFLTYNPPKSANNWVNRYSLIPKKGQYIHDSDYLNVPAEWLGQPFIDEAEFLKKINEDAYNHEYLGYVTGTGGQVFDNLEIREITDDEIATFGEALHGNDWGYFPDPYSYGKMYYDPARLTLYIFGEYRSYKQSNLQSYESIKENGYNQDELLIADSAEPKSISDYAEYGAWVRGAEKGPGSVTYSMKWLQSRAKIVLDPARVPFHTQEFTEYELEQDKNGDFISAYPDKNNHAIDDARYATNLIWRRRGE